MKKRILMVWPEFPVTFWSMKHALRFVGKKAATIPLGLLTVAALLPEDYDVTLVDMNVSRLTDSRIKKADLVFLSAMLVQQRSFAAVVARCNRLGVPVVAGGPYPSSSPETIPGVDYFVLNEAELTLPLFLGDYEAGTPRKIYATDEKPDITLTPPPRFGLVDFRHYHNISLQYSRGCPFDCEFCDIVQMFGRVPRVKSNSQFMHEMDLVLAQGFRGPVFIVDDNFIANKQRVKGLLAGIILWQKEHGYPFSLFTEASINLADDDELIQLMVDAGFNMVFVGIETPDAASLASCGKNQNLGRSLHESVGKIQKAGLQVTGGFIVGFDSDTEDIFDRQVGFIQKAGIPLAMVGILGAIPHTRLYNRLAEEGRLKPGQDYSGNNTHSLQMNFTPVMPEPVIIRGYKRILKELYNPRNYFNRCLTLIKRLPAAQKHAPVKITLTNISALFKSLIRQTFSSYSLYYTSFILRIFFTRIRHFPLAVEQAIQGHHFMLITRRLLRDDRRAERLA
jgi:radical SAM superfamily enzyme YgiQ (UPF0313 family)